MADEKETLDVVVDPEVNAAEAIFHDAIKQMFDAVRAGRFSTVFIIGIGRIDPTTLRGGVANQMYVGCSCDNCVKSIGAALQHTAQQATANIVQARGPNEAEACQPPPGSKLN